MTTVTGNHPHQELLGTASGWAAAPANRYHLRHACGPFHSQLLLLPGPLPPAPGCVCSCPFRLSYGCVFLIPDSQWLCMHAPSPVPRTNILFKPHSWTPEEEWEIHPRMNLRPLPHYALSSTVTQQELENATHRAVCLGSCMWFHPPSQNLPKGWFISLGTKLEHLWVTFEFALSSTLHYAFHCDLIFWSIKWEE